MNTSFMKRGVSLYACALMSLPVAATEDIFSDVIVVSAPRSQSDAKIFYGDDAMPFAADTATLIGRLPGAAIINNGSLSGQVQYRGAYGFRVGTRLNGQTFRSGGPNLMDPPMHYAPPTLVDTIKVNRGAAPVSFGPSLVGGLETKLKQVPFADSNMLENSYDVTAIGRSAESGHAVGLLGGVSNSKLRAYGYYSDENGSDRRFSGGDVDTTSYAREVYGLGFGFRNGTSEWDIEIRRQDTGPTGNPPFSMDIDRVETDFARLRFITKLARTTVEVVLGYSEVYHGMNNFDQRPSPMPMRHRETIASGTTYSLNLGFVSRLGVGDLKYGVDVEEGEHDAAISNPNNSTFFVSSVPNVEQERVGAFVSWKGNTGPGNLEVGVRADRYEDSSGRSMTGPAVPGMARMLAMAFNQSKRVWDDTAVDLLVRYSQESALGIWRFSLARKNRSPMYLERYGWLPIPASAGLADGNNYIGDLTLDKETALIAEVGVDVIGGRWWLRPSVFYHDIEDYIQGAPLDPTPGIIDNPVEMVSNMNGDLTPLRFSNLDAKLYGFDADYGFQLSERWRLEGVVSVVRGKRLDINDDLYRISPDRISMALVYEQSNWSASLTLEGVQAQGNVSRTNSEEETAGYGLVHLFGHWQFKEDIKISGGIENLMDLKYAQHLAGYNRVSDSEVELGNRLPGTGRNLFLKISLKK